MKGCYDSILSLRTPLIGRRKLFSFFESIYGIVRLTLCSTMPSTCIRAIRISMIRTSPLPKKWLRDSSSVEGVGVRSALGARGSCRRLLPVCELGERVHLGVRVFPLAFPPSPDCLCRRPPLHALSGPLRPASRGVSCLLMCLLRFLFLLLSVLRLVKSSRFG